MFERLKGLWVLVNVQNFIFGWRVGTCVYGVRLGGAVW